MPTVTQLILASTSPFRRKLMETAGFCFEAVSSDVDEQLICHPAPREQARLRSESKALEVAKRHPGALVIGADQVLSFRGESFDKVRSADEARQRLTLLAGNVHHLHSAYALVFCEPGDDVARILVSRVIDVAMPMRALSLAEIDAYLGADEWRGSVGCYQFEHCGGQLFEEVSSDQSTIVGLPLQDLAKQLRELGINALLAPKPPWNLASF